MNEATTFVTAGRTGNRPRNGNLNPAADSCRRYSRFKGRYLTAEQSQSLNIAVVTQKPSAALRLSVTKKSPGSKMGQEARQDLGSSEDDEQWKTSVIEDLLGSLALGTSPGSAEVRPDDRWGS